ncbi:sensor histidine kinase [Kitasatospora purpeofusca]|uniref:sensor histidine kinase n=2 Tax=Kitasatospora purpeofusca TaxID=67352 RepID=UPI00225B951E|nr:sensor histidine kinase [Kitasatospora purpeofusca]MCX4753530.1 sensor histidine kinase [Kitasatospora purpeofusca]WSR33022.1 sensor histidine kinase [Kitasatospora purpeofusca]WSR41091.1 sensor histidine kinase [Kitasatospora purpeofusca]
MHRLNAWLRRHPMVIDSVWAAMVLFVGVLPEDGSEDGGWRLGVHYAIAVALPLLMVFRRRFPDATVAAAGLIGIAQVLLDVNPAISSIAYLIFAYTGAAFGRPWTSRFALFGGLLAGPLVYWRLHPQKIQSVGDSDVHFVNYSAPEALLIIGLMTTPFLLCWGWGRLTRVRRAYLVELEDRAARLERERDAQSKVAVAAERARIARELHDVVAHNVSVMIVQADGAAYVLDNSPQQAKEALSTIASTGRQALVEMRRLLGVLRSADSKGEEYVPQPGVEELPELLDQVRTAGLQVDFATSGHPRELPRGVELTVYRIVQEALTNVRKHGGPDVHARVAVDFGERELAVLVEDDGRGSTDEQLASGGPDGQGHGLIGMRERVGMVSGSLDIGPRPGGGFRIRAVLPLKAA